MLCPLDMAIIWLFVILDRCGLCTWSVKNRFVVTCDAEIGLSSKVIPVQTQRHTCKFSVSLAKYVLVRSRWSQLILFLPWSPNWTALLATCLVIVNCPSIGHLVMRFVIDQLDRCRLQTPAQVGSWLVNESNYIFFVIFWSWLFIYRYFVH